MITLSPGQAPPMLEHEPLSPAQFAIAKSAISDLTAKELAKKHFVTVKTIKFHLTEIYKKCGVNNRAGLVAKYLPATSLAELRAEVERLNAQVLELQRIIGERIGDMARDKRDGLLPFGRPK